MEKIIKGKDVALKIIKEISELKKDIKTSKPTLAIIRVGEHGDDITYEKSIIKRFDQLEIETKQEVLDLNTSLEQLLSVIEKLNNDSSVNGIIILRPLPNHIDEDIIAQAINPLKDIDGMSHINIARLFLQNEQAIVPCTPQSVMEILDYLGISLGGKDITIVGAGMAVGRPLSVLLSNQRATITICRSMTKDLVKECKEADIVIAATGQAKLIKAEHIKDGAIVIDVGINLDENNKLVGDVDFEQVVDKVKHITPVPGGVGSLTTYILAKQLYKAIILQEK
ncbi:MAG: bifunctional 5,10-methylenetetrahydrofolate dehydrogenase/5,10-methenyltetrahydrofolate cyclohydrolase [Erysipelotrichales bacterium]